MNKNNKKEYFGNLGDFNLGDFSLPDFNIPSINLDDIDLGDFNIDSIDITDTIDISNMTNLELNDLLESTLSLPSDFKGSIGDIISNIPEVGDLANQLPIVKDIFQQLCTDDQEVMLKHTIDNIEPEIINAEDLYDTKLKEFNEIKKETINKLDNIIEKLNNTKNDLLIEIQS